MLCHKLMFYNGDHLYLTSITKKKKSQIITLLTANAFFGSNYNEAMTKFNSYRAICFICTVDQEQNSSLQSRTAMN